MKQLSLLVLLSIAVINVYATEIYWCQDEDGNIQYTQIPSAECREKVNLSLSQSLMSGTSTKVQKEIKKAAQSSEAATRTTLEEDCKIARNNLAVLNSNKPVNKPDKDNPGQFLILTDEMRQQEKAETQAYIDKYCTKKESKD